MTHSFPTTLIRITCKGGEGEKKRQVLRSTTCESSSISCDIISTGQQISQGGDCLSNSTRVMGLVGDEWQMSRRVI